MIRSILNFLVSFVLAWLFFTLIWSAIEMWWFDTALQYKANLPQCGAIVLIIMVVDLVWNTLKSIWRKTKK